MTLSEFKAWFEGFSEGIDKVPTEKQFAKIKAKVAEIDGAPVTERIYVDRYWPTWSRPYPSWWNVPYGTYSSGQSSATFGQFSYAHVDPASKGDNQTREWDSHVAMRDLGRAEAVN